MRILNIATFGPEERAEFRVVLRGNVISSLKTLIQANAGKVAIIGFFESPNVFQLGKGKTFEASERVLQMVSGNVCCTGDFSSALIILRRIGLPNNWMISRS